MPLASNREASELFMGNLDCAMSWCGSGSLRHSAFYVFGGRGATATRGNYWIGVGLLRAVFGLTRVRQTSRGLHACCLTTADESRVPTEEMPSSFAALSTANSSNDCPV